MLSPGSPIHTPGQHDSDGSGTSLRGREAPGYNQSRDRTRSPGVITRPRSAHRGYRDRSNALSYNGPNLGATSGKRLSESPIKSTSALSSGLTPTRPLIGTLLRPHHFTALHAADLCKMLTRAQCLRRHPLLPGQVSLNQ